MKRSYWLIAGGIAFSIITGVTLASMYHSNPTESPPKTSVPPHSNSSQSPTIKLLQPKSENNLAQKPNLDNFPHQPLNLKDRIKPGSDFDRFRKKLRTAVRSRDAKFIRSIATPNIRLSLGDPTTLDDLDLNNHNAPIWLAMEKAFGVGCNKPPETVKRLTWVCPHVFAVWPKKIDPVHYVAIVGENINVRDRPNNDSQVVGTLSNEAVELDKNALQQAKLDINNLNDWTPVILPNKQHGYVSNHYVYSPVGYRGFFEKIGGKWKMTTFRSGD